MFSRRSYVAYTATPFANVFVNHVSDDDMKRQDGICSRLHHQSPSPRLRWCRADISFEEEFARDTQIAEDTGDLIPFSHKKDFTFRNYPDLFGSQFAILFVLLCRDLTGHEGKKHSMMINVSRFNAVQEGMTLSANTSKI